MKLDFLSHSALKSTLSFSGLRLKQCNNTQRLAFHNFYQGLIFTAEVGKFFIQGLHHYIKADKNWLNWPLIGFIFFAIFSGIILVARYFNKRRGIANAFCLSGTATGSFFIPCKIIIF